MSFSYDEALDTELDRVRFALGDTNPDAPLIEDETIAARLAVSTEAETVAFLAQGLAVKFAYQPDRVSIPGGPSVAYSRVSALTAAANTAGKPGASTARSIAAARDEGEPLGEYDAPVWGGKWSPYDD